VPTATRDEFVTDASAAIRMVFGLAPGLRSSITALGSIAPGQFPLECVSALQKYVRLGEIDSVEADSALNDILSLPISFVETSRLAREALRTALESGLSACDAAYVVVARAANARLITADRDLAAAYEHAELIA
jgi:predicted nucleic acid-binding protein